MSRHPDFNQMKEYFEEIAADYAKKKGVFPDLVSGNLTDKKATPVGRQFTFDTSCGDASISDDGTATIKKIKGNTTNPNQLVMDSNLNKANGDGLVSVTDGTANDASGVMYGKSYVKNQLAKELNNTNWIASGISDVSYNNNEFTGTFSDINSRLLIGSNSRFPKTKDHYYLQKVQIKIDTATSGTIIMLQQGGGEKTLNLSNLSTSYKEYSMIFKASAAQENCWVDIQNISYSGVLHAKDYEFIDLTQWFGSNDAIPADLLADPTLWETKYWHGGYINYDTGTIVNNNSKWQATGKNMIENVTYNHGSAFNSAIIGTFVFYPGRSYYLSFKTPNDGVNYYYTNYSTDEIVEGWSPVVGDGTRKRIKITPKKVLVHNNRIIINNQQATTENCSEFMISLVEDVTYEVYHDGGTVDCTDLELKGVGDVRDEFDSASGKITRKFIEYTITGSEPTNWYDNTSDVYNRHYGGNIDLSSIPVFQKITGLVGLTSKGYKFEYANTDKTVYSSNGTGLNIIDDSYDTKAKWLAGITGMKIILNLKTPISETVTPQPLETKLGVNSFFETDGDVDYNATLAYQGTHYDISLLSSHKYFFRDKSAGTESIITGLTSQTVDALPNGTGDNLCDLTRWFGSGNEPADPAALYHIYPLLRNPIPGTPGVLVNYKGTSIATVGFNQWDEEWENGAYNADTGEKYDSASNQIRSKNTKPIRVLPNTSYYCKVGSNKSAILLFYDINGTFLKGWSSEGTYGSYISKANGTFTTPSNAYYMKFYMITAYGNTYQNDICINLSWSGYRNGEYEQYWKKVLDLSRVQNIYRHATKGYIVGGEFTSGWLSLTEGGSALTPVTGNLYKVMTQGDYYNSIYKWNGIVYVLATEQEKLLFPDGLCSAGNVYDEVTSTGAIKRITKIVLDGQTTGKKFTYQGIDGDIVYFAMIGTNLKSDVGTFKSIISNLLPYDFGVGSVAYTRTTTEYIPAIKLKDQTLDTLNKGNAWLKDLYDNGTPFVIYCELKDSEQLITFDDNADTGSANQTSELDLSYDVADFGTEESLPESDTVIPAYAPLLADIAYSSDFTRQIATMYKNYQSQDSMDALLTVIGNALGGTITKTWDEAAGKWSYTFTRN